MIYPLLLLFFFCATLSAECPCKQKKMMPAPFEQELQAAISLAKLGNASIISQNLKSRFPGHGLAMQEPRISWMEQQYVWVMTENRDYVQIGLMENGKAVVGVYYFPASDNLYWAAQGKGAYRQVKEDAAMRLRTSRVAMLQPSDRMDSVGLHIGYLLEGVFTGFSEEAEDVKDFLAGDILLAEAGGKVSDRQGHPIDYRLEGRQKVVASSNYLLHRRFLAELSR